MPDQAFVAKQPDGLARRQPGHAVLLGEGFLGGDRPTGPLAQAGGPLARTTVARWLPDAGSVQVMLILSPG